MSIEIRFHGVRGSHTVARGAMSGYGGFTTCVELSRDDGDRLLLDAGGGLLGPGLEGVSGCVFDLLLTHYHLDHLEGLPFFPALYQPESTFVFHGPSLNGTSVDSAMEQLIRPPWYPVALGETASRKQFVDLPDDFEVGGYRVRNVRQLHPQGSVAYRLDRDDCSVVFASDTERGDPAHDDAFLRLAQGTDLLIHDAQFVSAEVEEHRGWGHSSWRQAVETARACQAKRLILFHHDPKRTDAELDEIVAQARSEFDVVDAAREGAILRISR